MTIVVLPRLNPEQSETEVLFPEAREIERHRRLMIAAAITIALVLIIGLIATLARSPGKSIATTKSPPSAEPDSVTPRVRAQFLKALIYPTQLAVSPSGHLFIGDIGLDRVVERLTTGRFDVFAGTGHQGFAGDGGPAKNAEFSAIGDMVFAPNGSLYIADANRIREVTPRGTILTVAGDGASSYRSIANGTPAVTSPIGAPSGLTMGPGGDLYFTARNNQILRLNSDGTLSVMWSSNTFNNICGASYQALPAKLAFIRSGDLYVAMGGPWELVEVNKSGDLHCLGPLRGAGGVAPALARGPGGVLYGDTQNALVQINGSRFTDFHTFLKHKVPRVRFTFAPGDIAVGPNGTIYSDTIANNGWSGTTAVIAITPNRHVVTLWAKNEPKDFESK